MVPKWRGSLQGWKLPPARVAVFIDYQNVYKGARNAFCWGSGNHADGQVDPLKVGGIIKGLRSPVRALSDVRVYRGMPSNNTDSKGYSAALRQVSLWDQHHLVTPRVRPLNYGDPAGPREKGIDVLLAVDFVLGAARNEYDIGVIFSADTDLIPALEAVIAMKGEQAVEVACWVPPQYGLGGRQHPKPLSVKGHLLHRHGLREAEYNLVHDATDYTRQRKRR